MKSQPKILIVDDTPENIIAIKSILKHSGAELHDAKSGNEALSMMLRHDYAVALVDVRMPGMDGFELVSLMRDNSEMESIPAIFITANSQEDQDIQKGYDVGAVDYLFKPVDRNILTKKIKIFIQLHHQKIQLQEEMEKYRQFVDKVVDNDEIIVAEQSVNIHPSVLIVDDNNDNLISMSKVLQKLSVNIETCRSGQEALNLIDKNDYAVILLDVQMPGLDGFDVANQLVSCGEFNKTPIIFITAINRDDENVMRGYYSGAVDYLFKPIEPTVLLSKVQVFLTLYQQRSKLNFLLNEKEDLVAKIKSKNSELGYMAYHDGLTDISNRLGFQKAICKAVYSARRYYRHFALLFIDLDHFKSINDTYGHEYGDLILQECAKRLRQVMRASDTVARLGGDEFGLILDQIESKGNAGAVAKKIIEILSKNVSIKNNEFKIGVSIGVVYYPDEDIVIDTEKSDQEIANLLVQYADVAMYRVKKDGRSAYQYFTNEFSQLHHRRLLIESGLNFAIDKEEFYLVYQPKFHLIDKKIEGIEVLLRWKHSQMGDISPSEFIPIAEDSKIIFSVGDWVLEAACQQLCAWHNQGYKDLKLAINVSTKQLVIDGFANKVENILHKYNLTGDCLEIEITETAMMANSKSVYENIELLHGLGINIMLDDFGTGYSLLSQLKKLPIQGLKIDIEFIREVTTNPSDAMITKAIINLAENLCLTVVAEGIETEDQLHFLIKHGCKMGQGYLYSRPLLPEGLIQFISQNKSDGYFLGANPPSC